MATRQNGNCCPRFAAISLETDLGEKLDLSVADARIIKSATPPASAGYHLAEALVQVGETPQKRLFKIKVNDPEGEARIVARLGGAPIFRQGQRLG